MRLTMEIKAVSKRGNRYYWTRFVPRSLQEAYGKKLVRIKMQSMSLQDLKVEAAELDNRFEAEMAYLRGDTDQVDKTSAQYALKLADPAEWKIEGAKGQEKIDMMHTALLDMAEGPNGLAARKAADMLMTDAPLLSHAVEDWKRWKGNTLKDKGERHLNMSINHLMAAIGDKPITMYSRKEANQFIRYCVEERKMKVSSVQRNIANLSSLFNRAINSNDLDMANPWTNLDLPREEPSEGPGKFDEAELEAVRDLAVERDTPAALIALMQMNTGASVGEIAGLRLEDVDLDSNIPHIKIVPHRYRTLKTTARPRSVPLVGVSLDAAKKAVAKLGADDFMLFPSYLNAKTELVKNETASASVNKMVKLVNKKRTSHSFRHSMVNRLQREGTDLLVHYQITGHSLKTVNEQSYNRSEIPLQHKLDALLKVAVR